MIRSLHAWLCAAALIAAAVVSGPSGCPSDDRARLPAEGTDYPWPGPPEDALPIAFSPILESPPARACREIPRDREGPARVRAVVRRPGGQHAPRWPEERTPLRLGPSADASGEGLGVDGLPGLPGVASTDAWLAGPETHLPREVAAGPVAPDPAGGVAGRCRLLPEAGEHR